jgi:hypothetical protein
MKRALKRIDAITVEQLRADRSLLPEIFGVISDGLYGELYGLRGNINGLSGDVTFLRGDVSGLWGNLSVHKLRGDVSGLWGNLTGIYGEATGLTGNLNDCALTADERDEGVYVRDLIG